MLCVTSLERKCCCVVPQMLITGEMRLVEFDDGFWAARASNGDFLFSVIVLNFKLKTHNNNNNKQQCVNALGGPE